jgi:hypothetical protein
MSDARPTRLRARLGWLALLVLLPLAYQVVRVYALRSRSLEVVLGLVPGDPAWHVCVAVALLVLRFAAYGVVGGVLLAWPLEEWLVRRRAAAAAREGPGS